MQKIIATVLVIYLVFLPSANGGNDMARESRPQPGRSTTYPNAGPYTANQWGEVFRDFIVGEDFPNVGVFYSTSNQLEVTNPAATNISVNTGRANVFGRDFRNTAAQVITPTDPANNTERIDRVVAVLNNTNAAISTQSPTGYTFSVAGSVTSIPAYTIELAIMQGTAVAFPGAPVAPALEQSASRLWMIPLAQYNIENNAGAVAISAAGITDEREWVDAETKTVLVQLLTGYDITGVAQLDLVYDISNGGSYILLADANDSAMQGRFVIPQDFISDAECYAVLIPLAAGNVVNETQAAYGAVGEAWNLNTDIPGTTADAVTTDISIAGNVPLATAAIGDYVVLDYRRYATDPNDTVDADVLGIGFRLQYFGWKR